MTTPKNYDTPPSPLLTRKSEWNRLTEGWQHVLHVPFSPALSLPGSFHVHNSAGTAEITTLPRNVAVFNSMGKDKDTCLGLSPKPRVFLKWSAGTPLLSGPAILETWIQREGRMDSVLDVPHSPTWKGPVLMISPFLLTVPCVPRLM